MAPLTPKQTSIRSCAPKSARWSKWLRHGFPIGLCGLRTGMRAGRSWKLTCRLLRPCSPEREGQLDMDPDSHRGTVLLARFKLPLPERFGRPSSSPYLVSSD